METASVTSNGVAHSSALRSSAARSMGSDDRAQDKAEFFAKVDAAAQKADISQDRADASAHAAHAQAIREALKQKQAATSEASARQAAQQAAQKAEAAVKVAPRAPIAVRAPLLKDDAEAAVAAEDAPAVEENSLDRLRASENRASESRASVNERKAPPTVDHDRDRQASRRKNADSSDQEDAAVLDEAPVFQPPPSPVPVEPFGANPNEALNPDSSSPYVVRTVPNHSEEPVTIDSYGWQSQGASSFSSAAETPSSSSVSNIQAPSKSEPIAVKVEPFVVPGVANFPIVSSFAGASLNYTAGGAMGPAMPVRGSIVNIPA